MSENLRPIALDDLEARLADLAGALAFPPTPDLASVVGSRLRAGATAPRQPIPFRRSLRRSLLLAAALVMLVVGAAVAVRLGLDLLQIRFGPVPTFTPAPSTAGPSPASSVLLGSSLRLGQPTPLADAAAAAGFDVLVPAGIGPPDIVYVGGPALRGQVAFVYAPRGNLPLAGLLGGAGLLITQSRGELDDGLVSKLLDAELATIQTIDVNGAAGVWIAGRPHVFWYLAPDGSVIEESRRYVGDTLAWEREGVLYRIEGNVTLEQALEIARAMG